MSAPSPVFLLLAAFICSMIGRALLIRAAWEISKAWGFAVLCVPLAPMFFRMNYKELAYEGKNWRTMTTVFFVAFMAITGSSGSIDDLWAIVPEKFRPAETAEQLPPEPGQQGAETLADGTAPASASAASAKASKVQEAPAKKGFMARLAALVSPSSPEPAKPAAGPLVATLTPPLTVVPTLAERVAANQQEFARLGEVYESLKKERGYLKKWDQDAIKSYNELAAKYQADLAKARADQTELNKQLVAKK